MDDLISRQQAISHVDDVPYIKEHPNVGLLWKAWIESLPSAQPEIIRCKDCKHKHIKDNVWTCPFGLPAGCDFYCGYAERKEE